MTRRFTKYPSNYVRADMEQLSIYDMDNPNQMSIDDLKSDSSTMAEDEIGTRFSLEFDYSNPISMKELVSCIESVVAQYGHKMGSFFIADFKDEMINDYNERGFSEWANEKDDYDAYIDFTIDGNPAKESKFFEFRRALIRSIKPLGCEGVNIFSEYGWEV